MSLVLLLQVPPEVQPVALPGGDALWQVGASILAMVVLAIFRAVWKDVSAKREEILAWAVSTAYHATNELAAMTETKLDDKVATALRYLDEALQARRGKPATEAERGRAMLAWKALHGLEKKQAELAGGPP